MFTHKRKSTKGTGQTINMIYIVSALLLNTRRLGLYLSLLESKKRKKMKKMTLTLEELWSLF